MIYIHIPFCRSFCNYCGFYSEVCRQGSPLVGRFVDALCSEIRERAGEISSERKTIYIGGGTPSVLPLSFLESIVGTVRQVTGCNDWEEFTVEVNPDDITPEYAAGLKGLGATRVSMGVQSLDDIVLKWMNRRHSAAQAVGAYNILREAGFENISVDLIFGFHYPGSAPDHWWERSIDGILDMGHDGSAPPHISAYQLSVEQGSALERMVSDGRFTEADDGYCAAQYEILCRKLSDAGYHHYEISNFARPGFEAVHNSGYWEHIPYTGFGPGAHSFSISGGSYVRSWNEADINDYLSIRSRGSECLSREQQDTERIMLSLRTDKGMERQYLASRCGSSKLESMLSLGNLVQNEDAFLRIPEGRFFVSDNIISGLL